MSYPHIDKIDKRISFIHKKVKLHRNAILIFSVLILFIISFPSIYNIYLNFNPPTPPENQLVVAITPFYYVDEFGNEGYDINIRYDFKEKLDDLGIKTILHDFRVN